MTPSELIVAAYNTSISPDVVEEAFKLLCTKHDQKWDDLEKRTTPTLKDLNTVYTL